MDDPVQNGDKQALLSSSAPLGAEDSGQGKTSNDQQKLMREASLMTNVWKRLETTTNVFAVPGVDLKASDLERPTTKHRLKPRKTCGREVSISFRMLLLCTMTVIMVLTMTALLVTQIVISRDVSNSLIASCNDATSELLNASSELIRESLVFIARGAVNDASLDLRSFLLTQAQAQVGSMSNFLTSFKDGATFNETSAFMSRQVRASYTNSIDMLSLGKTNNEYLDYAFCHRDPYLLGDIPVVSVIGECPFTQGATVNGTLLQRCEQQARDLSFSRNLTCKSYPNFVVVEQQPVKSQLAFAGQNPKNATGFFIWSDPYIVQGFQYEFQGETRDMIAVSLSYPAFNSTCSAYDCVDTFIWAPITSRSFAGFCRSEMSNPNGSLQFSNIQNNSAFYIVDGRSSSFNGTLLGASVGKNSGEVAIIPETVYAATHSPEKVIRQSAQYLLQEYRTFANPAFDLLIVTSFYTNSLEPCDSGFNGSFIPNCTLVAALSVESPRTEPLFATEAPARFVLVFSIPFQNLATPLTQQYLEAQVKATEQRQAQEQAINSLIGVGVGIAIASIVAGLLVAWCMAVRVTVPIGKLDRTMRNLMSFNFQVNETDYLSRVTDISNAEQTMESLSNAIEVFSKFVPQTVVRGIVQGRPESTRLHVEHRVVTVAFSDIKGFTSISEKLEISDLLFFLTRYLTVMTEVVERYEGTVTEILGDGLLILWNAPDDCEFHAAKACAAALAMQAAVEFVAKEFHSILSLHGLEKLSVRVGIHTGKVLAGNIGSTTKLKYGCLGDTVNTASRLEGLCKLYEVGVICSKDTFDMLPEGEHFQCRELDLVQVKGKDLALGLFEVQALRQKVVIREVDAAGESTPGSANNNNRAKLRWRREFPSSAISLSKLSTTARNVFHPTMAAARTSTQQKFSSGEVRTSMNSFGPIQAQSDIINEEKRLVILKYERALHLFQEGNFNECIKDLNSIASVDPPSRLLRERCEKALMAIEKGMLDMQSWNGGVNRLTEKF